MKTTLRHISTQRLASFARQFQIDRAEDAAGRCLSVSLDLALAAKQRHGLDVQLVKWHVVGDPSYVDHWAVLLDDERVIDPTRVQVDGRPRLVNAIGDYPRHYVDRRVYPAALLTTAYVASGAHEETRLTNGFLWACGVRLLRFDLAAAWRERDLARATSAVREARNFLACFLTGCLTRALESRAHRLIEQLHGAPDIPARSSRHMPRRADAAGSPSQGAGALAADRVLWAAGAFTPAANTNLYNLCTLLIACA